MHATITVHRFMGRTLVDILDIPLSLEAAHEEMAKFRQMPGHAAGNWQDGMLVITCPQAGQPVRFDPRHARATLIAHGVGADLVDQALSEAWGLAQWAHNEGLLAA